MLPGGDFLLRLIYVTFLNFDYDFFDWGNRGKGGINYFWWKPRPHNSRHFTSLQSTVKHLIWDAPLQAIKLLITQMQLAHGLAAVPQLHLHSQLNTWLQWIGQRKLQNETRSICILGFAAAYIISLTVYAMPPRDSSQPGIPTLLRLFGLRMVELLAGIFSLREPNPGRQRWLLRHSASHIIYIIITNENIRYLLWNRGFWRSLNNTYPIFVYSLHLSFMWFLWLNWRKFTFYPVTAPKDSKCWPTVTSSIQEPTASNCDVTMTDCSRVVVMDAFLAQWCWGQWFKEFVKDTSVPSFSTIWKKNVKPWNV